MSGPNEESPLEYLEITNGLEETIEMGYHGDRYVWEPGEQVLCTTLAAAHIFGFGRDMNGRVAAFHRLGWVSTAPECNYKNAMKKLAKITFKPVEQVFQMPTGEERKKRGRKRSNLGDRPLPELEGGAGEEQSSPAVPTGTDEPAF